MGQRIHFFNDASGTNWSNQTNALLQDGAVASFLGTQPTVSNLRLFDIDNVDEYLDDDEINGILATLFAEGTGGPKGPARGIQSATATIYSAQDDAANVLDGNSATYYGYATSAVADRAVSVIIDLGEAKTIGNVASRVHFDASGVSNSPTFWKSSDGVNWTQITFSAPPADVFGPIDADFGGDLSTTHNARFFKIRVTDGDAGADNSMPRVYTFRLYQTGGVTEVVRTITMTEKVDVALSLDGTSPFGDWQTVSLGPSDDEYTIGDSVELWGNAEILGEDIKTSTFSVLVRRHALVDGHEVATDRLVDFVGLTSYYTTYVSIVMSENASVFQTTQIAKETTAGVAVQATKRLLGTSIEITPKQPATPIRPYGSKAFTEAVPMKGWSEAAINGTLNFNDLVYMLCSLLENITPTTPGGATDTRRWTFKPENWGPDDKATYTIEYGYDGVFASRIAYAFVNALSLSLSPEEVPQYTGSILAREIDDNITMSPTEVWEIDLDGGTGGTFTLTVDTGTGGAQETSNIVYSATAATLAANIIAALEAESNIAVGDVEVEVTAADVFRLRFVGSLKDTNLTSVAVDDTLLTGGSGNATATNIYQGGVPTDVALVPVSPKNISFYVADDEAGLASADAQERILSVDLSVGDRNRTLFTLNAADSSWTVPVEKAPTMNGNIRLMHDAAAHALVQNLKNGDIKFLRVLISQGEIEANFPYRIQITMPVVFTDNTRGDNNDVYASELPFTMVYHPTFGSYIEVVVDTTLTAL